MEELIKKIKELSKKQGGLTIEDIADFETAVIEEMIKVESVSELIREQVIIDLAAEEVEEEDNSKATKTEEMIEGIKKGLNDDQIKRKYTKNDFIAAATELDVVEKAEKDTQQAYLDVIRKAVG